MDNTEALRCSSNLKLLWIEYEKYYEEHAKTSAVLRFWLSYTNIVTLLLQFLRSMRFGNWKLHLKCIITETSNIHSAYMSSNAWHGIFISFIELTLW